MNIVLLKSMAAESQGRQNPGEESVKECKPQTWGRLAPVPKRKRARLSGCRTHGRASALTASDASGLKGDYQCQGLTPEPALRLFCQSRKRSLSLIARSA